MLTQMTEEDWSIAVEVFQAVHSKRGEPGHNDRKFLEALHYFTVLTLPGGRFRRSSAIGTACGSAFGGSARRGRSRLFSKRWRTWARPRI